MHRRLHLRIKGVVQGVGFRPAFYRLAKASGVQGWVRNTGWGVEAEIEGHSEALQRLLGGLSTDLPAAAHISDLQTRELPPAGMQGFRIIDSETHGAALPLLPDTALCDACLDEMRDPADRRYRYPFITCNTCGPRYSILGCTPFDRRHTSMRRFPMCPACRQEYLDPGNRRFHAQTISCPDCGPRLSYRDAAGHELVRDNEAALARAVACLKDGGIVAVKGIGGFHLMCLATDAAAVARLRRRKHRPRKPLAVMFADMGMLQRYACPDAAEAGLLAGPVHPIVILAAARSGGPPLAEGSGWLGAMLAYAPLHVLLFEALGRPLVATSGNAPGEPICYRNAEALDRLREVVDGFLLHNRNIVRPLEDPLVRCVEGDALWLRLGRGTMPLHVSIPWDGVDTLALGGQTKSAFAIGQGRMIHAGPYLGDLDRWCTIKRQRVMLRDAIRLHQARIERVATDSHPDWTSTREGERWPQPKLSVQHHHAHVLAVMAEHGLSGPVLGVAWDGSGWGDDASVWGGEFLVVDHHGYRRHATFWPFLLAGGEAAIRRPARLALAALFEAMKHELWLQPDPVDLLGLPRDELHMLRRMLEKGGHCLPTSSAGRLFDVVSALLGLCREVSFEGEAAMLLEQCAGRDGDESIPAYPFRLEGEAPVRIDWRPMLRDIVRDVLEQRPAAAVAMGFHQTMARIIAAVSCRSGVRDVVLAGGCFQNALLLELTRRRLKEHGMRVHQPMRIPPNDSGLAVGQALAGML